MQIELIDILLLPMVFFIGTVTTWEDYKFHKIPNHWLLLGLAYGALVYLGLIVWNIIGEPITQAYFTQIKGLMPDDPRPIFSIPFRYFFDVGLNSAAALLIGFGLWKYGQVAAGDAKLFFVLTLLLPLKYYWKSFLPVFPAYALVINIFTIVLIYILVQSLIFFFRRQGDIFLNPLRWWTTRQGRQKSAEVKNSIFKSSRNILSILLWLTALMLGLQLLDRPLQNWLSFSLLSVQPFIFVTIIILRRVVSDFFKNPKALIAIIIILSVVMVYGLITDPVNTINLTRASLKTTIIFIILLTIITKLINFYNQRAGVKKIPLDELKPGQILAKETIMELRKNANKTQGKIKLSRGLNKEQVEKLKSWARKNNTSYIKIQEPFPFALWIFLGVILTVILQGSFLNKILDLLR